MGRVKRAPLSPEYGTKGNVRPPMIYVTEPSTPAPAIDQEDNDVVMFDDDTRDYELLTPNTISTAKRVRRSRSSTKPPKTPRSLVVTLKIGPFEEVHYQTMTTLLEYKDVSLEEIRFRDYESGNKYGSGEPASTQVASTIQAESATDVVFADITQGASIVHSQRTTDVESTDVVQGTQKSVTNCVFSHEISSSTTNSTNFLDSHTSDADKDGTKIDQAASASSEQPEASFSRRKILWRINMNNKRPITVIYVEIPTTSSTAEALTSTERAPTQPLAGSKRSASDAHLPDRDDSPPPSGTRRSSRLKAKAKSNNGNDNRSTMKSGPNKRQRVQSDLAQTGSIVTDIAPVEAPDAEMTNVDETSSPGQTNKSADVPTETQTTHTTEDETTHGNSTATATDAVDATGGISHESESDAEEVLHDTNTLSRKDRIMNPANPTDGALIDAFVQAGKKASKDIYDSDADELPGNPSNVSNAKAHLFKNVKWGDAAFETSAETFEKTQYSAFMPGRFERLPGGGIRDQKDKLLVRVIDRETGERKIFRNPPPRDWASQEAMTALNKRTVQQLRRTTKRRLRQGVMPYHQEERQWILANLKEDGSGKPKKGWALFTVDFNEKFAGETLAGSSEPRQVRTKSSLSKEVERFAASYKAGKIPATKGRQTAA